MLLFLRHCFPTFNNFPKEIRYQWRLVYIAPNTAGPEEINDIKILRKAEMKQVERVEVEREREGGADDPRCSDVSNDS